MIKVVMISDTHGSHHELQMPEGDLLIHTGDYSSMGSWRELQGLNEWFGTLGYKDIICIDGNHDQYSSSLPREEVQALFTNAHYLRDSEITVQGLRVYGTPWTNRFGDWSFMESEPELKKRFAGIPEGFDILMSHGPAYGILDKNVSGNHCGSTALLERIKVTKPRYHVHGHIHESRGLKEGETVSLNVASLDEWYDIRGEPVVIEIETK